MVVGGQLGKLVGNLKSKFKSLKSNKKAAYNKVDKTDSMRIEIKSQRVRQLVSETMKKADSPRHKSFAF